MMVDGRPALAFNERTGVLGEEQNVQAGQAELPLSWRQLAVLDAVWPDASGERTSSDEER